MSKQERTVSDDTSSPEAAHQLTMQVEEGYLLAHAAGRRTWPVESSLVREVSLAAIENQREKILVDVRELEGLLGNLSSYSIVNEDFQRFRSNGIMKVESSTGPCRNSVRGSFKPWPATAGST